IFLVSIHAPAWGATVGDEIELLLEGGFNPRARVGRDEALARRYKNRIKFQSTRPRGARHAIAIGHWSFANVSIHAPAWGATRLYPPRTYRVDCFNPRARVGRDVHGARGCGTPDKVSIHAPAWG